MEYSIRLALEASKKFFSWARNVRFAIGFHKFTLKSEFWVINMSGLHEGNGTLYIVHRLLRASPGEVEPRYGATWNMGQPNSREGYGMIGPRR